MKTIRFTIVLVVLAILLGVNAIQSAQAQQLQPVVQVSGQSTAQPQPSATPQPGSSGQSPNNHSEESPLQGCYYDGQPGCQTLCLQVGNGMFAEPVIGFFPDHAKVEEWGECPVDPNEEPIITPETPEPTDEPIITPETPEPTGEVVVSTAVPPCTGPDCCQIQLQELREEITGLLFALEVEDIDFGDESAMLPPTEVSDECCPVIYEQFVRTSQNLWGLLAVLAPAP